MSAVKSLHLSASAGTEPLILPFERISAADLPRVGGKGANLGEMARAGFPVPPGFCVTTAAFDAFLAGSEELQSLYAEMDALDGKDVEAARRVAESTRALLGRAPIPPAVADAVLAAWRDLGTEATWAVRSSATAEDLPDASFAGQQDTYLNIRGAEALLDAVRRCWVSLFTDRAVLYRARSGFGHRGVKLSVVVQRMVLPEVSGILFTADPITGRRGTVSIDAGFGLGEALVSGLINADLYKVDKATGEILEVQVGDKALAIRPRPEGGTWEERLPEATRRARAMDDAALRELVAMGVRIETHYGKPQDIEWCIEAGRLYVVQARPITSLYPLPELAPGDEGLHVYLSFGHFQMMTDAMPPLSLQVWRLMFPLGRASSGTGDAPAESRTMAIAGSRLFLDLTPALRHPLLRRVVRGVLGHIYEDLSRGLETLAGRPAFQRGASGGRVSMRSAGRFAFPIIRRLLARLFASDPSQLRPWVEDFSESQLTQIRARLAAATPGAARLREARRVLSEILARAFLGLIPNIMVGLLANNLLKKLSRRGLLGGTEDDLSALDRGLPGNVTTEMDLAVGDLTDRVRPHPALAALLRSRPATEALAAAHDVEGGPAFLEAWRAFIERYGMRGPGEIDVSRPRYKNEPASLIAAIVGGIGPAGAGRSAGEHRAHHAALAAKAEAAGERLIAASRRGLTGGMRARLARRLVRLARAGMGLREHPKFLLVRVLDLVRDSVLEAGALLVQRGALGKVDDVYLFRFEELIAALESSQAPDLRPLAEERRATLRRDAKRSPPFVMASDGEIPSLAAREDLPPGALSGTAASAGVVEGLARVVLDPAQEVLHAGEILVAPHTDPGWTPLFVHASGLVTEVGGLMTHGSVVAREYGIPAVVSVSSATQRIRTGQRIRVDGTRGFVEILEGGGA
ncbi:phosphoenolpyruvate synthase [Vitiosangium sp. GDMCC 1.1324]|uniref:phosphoenolpyruvate synthase n=1 Tax=Vitiosangium sp. (strain GDMCC 1.1324) TaxID=2138576 RepID=UPI000D3D052B|nr:phosphoenolpyruvate synthase [Vitiosangium sp. GDMCC 1.1324]PTL83883.1 phosphoenolpyruvate synthase [Vitiosangium sp. GDMCC 1.1324]